LLAALLVKAGKGNAACFIMNFSRIVAPDTRAHGRGLQDQSVSVVVADALFFSFLFCKLLIFAPALIEQLRLNARFVTARSWSQPHFQITTCRLREVLRISSHARARFQALCPSTFKR
jgi:hypothetical protein